MSGDAPNPRRTFANPASLMADTHTTDAEKQALLTEWGSELDGRLNAESEGMSTSDPISATREARLADEAKQVQSALTALEAKTGL